MLTHPMSALLHPQSLLSPPNFLTLFRLSLTSFAYAASVTSVIFALILLSIVPSFRAIRRVQRLSSRENRPQRFKIFSSCLQLRTIAYLTDISLERAQILINMTDHVSSRLTADQMSRLAAASKLSIMLGSRTI